MLKFMRDPFSLLLILSSLLRFHSLFVSLSLFSLSFFSLPLSFLLLYWRVSSLFQTNTSSGTSGGYTVGKNCDSNRLERIKGQCAFFLQCSHGVWTQMPCAPTNYFNVSTQKCTNKDNVCWCSQWSAVIFSWVGLNVWEMFSAFDNKQISIHFQLQDLQTNSFCITTWCLSIQMIA